MCDNEEHAEQNAEVYEDERVVLANLIANLKLDHDENKKIFKQLKKANASLTHELNECKSALEESNNIRDRCRITLHDQEIELEKYKKYKIINLKKKRWQQPITHEITVLVNNVLIPLAIKTKANANAFERALKQEMFEDLEVIHRTIVSRPQLRSTSLKEKVTQNNSQVMIKQKEVEDHHRIYSFSSKTKFVTASNDSLKSKTSNVNAVCVTCGIYMFNSNHDACVSKFINDAKARTKKPKVVLISTRKPKRKENQYVATPYKKTVASESTNQKSKSYFRMLYENTSKIWTW
ncbi:hypothetical protein Tco_1561964 [Tanacetum coccineum]